MERQQTIDWLYALSLSMPDNAEREKEWCERFPDVVPTARPNRLRVREPKGLA